MQVATVIINGKRSDNLSTLDRGLLYGDGVFETIAIKQGQPQYWQEHLQRLSLGCETLGFSSLNDILLKNEMEQLIDVDQRCVIKIIITRGIGTRGYAPSRHTLTRIIQKFPWPQFPAHYTSSGIDITLCDLRLVQRTRLAQIKHLNRLEQVLARSEWEDEYQEGLVCDLDDHIIEATSSNVFFEVDDGLVTPDLKRCGVVGILRNQVINYCSDNGIKLSVRDFGLDEVDTIKGMFLCNSIIGIWPVRNFNKLVMSKTAIINELMSVFNT